ncbi:MAG: glycosyltransferase family 2 protein [Sporolactobacillus sp.]
MVYSSVAIIIVNWNNYDETIDCLKSLKKLVYKKFKIFIVDNGSSNDSVSYLKNYCSKQVNENLSFELMETGKNLGFAGGNNIAIRKALKEKFEFVWLLNNDTVVEPMSLTELVKIMLDDQQVGVSGSKIYYYNNPNRIWFAGGNINTWTGKASHIGYQEVDKGNLYRETTEVGYITGCSMLIRMDVIQQIGALPEYYFLYYEETEFNLMTKKRGWKIVFVPSSKIYHKASSSTGGENSASPMVNYYFLRNQFWLIYKTQPFFKYYICYIYILLKGLKRIVVILRHDKKNRWENVKAIFKALYDACRLRHCTKKG